MNLDLIIVMQVSEIGLYGYQLIVADFDYLPFLSTKKDPTKVSTKLS